MQITVSQLRQLIEATWNASAPKRLGLPDLIIGADDTTTAGEAAAEEYGRMGHRGIDPMTISLEPYEEHKPEVSDSEPEEPIDHTSEAFDNLVHAIISGWDDVEDLGFDRMDPEDMDRVMGVPIDLTVADIDSADVDALMADPRMQKRLKGTITDWLWKIRTRIEYDD